jgi:hypothetical protein
MTAAEESRAHAADQLREAESAISTVNRRLHELGLEVPPCAELGRARCPGPAPRPPGWGATEPVGPSPQPPVRRRRRGCVETPAGRKGSESGARDHYFLTHLSRAKAELIQRLRAAADEKKKLAEIGARASGTVGAIERQQQEQPGPVAGTQRSNGRRNWRRSPTSLQAQRREINTSAPRRTAPGAPDRGTDTDRRRKEAQDRRRHPGQGGANAKTEKP